MWWHRNGMKRAREPPKILPDRPSLPAEDVPYLARDLRFSSLSRRDLLATQPVCRQHIKAKGKVLRAARLCLVWTLHRAYMHASRTPVRLRARLYGTVCVLRTKNHPGPRRASASARPRTGVLSSESLQTTLFFLCLLGEK